MIMSGEEKPLAEDQDSDGQARKDTWSRTTTAEEDLEDLGDPYQDLPLTEDTTCGLGFVRGRWLQRFSNEKYYVCMYGLVGCMFGACFAYFNGTISTIEKRFKIPSKVSGVIVVGHDFSALLVGVFLSYYAGKQHRPRWIALGIYTVVLYCLLTLTPHLLYGVGEEALALTVEHGGRSVANLSASYVDPDLRNLLCFPGEDPNSRCRGDEGGVNVPAVILFLGNLISGVGGGLYHTIGMSYMDDNIEKHKIPFLISFAHFMRLLGPALGYSLASLSLETYIAPRLTPTIKPSDPRWLGAWWAGWILLAAVLFVTGSLLALFPRTLPAAATRRRVAAEKARLAGEAEPVEDRPSVRDMMESFWRLLRNKAYMSIQLSHIFYIFGYTPYWIFMAKYIETQYRISASKSSLFTGPFGIMFSALGTLLAGAAISRWRPSARAMAWWNLLVVLVNTAGIASYALLGCRAGDSYGATDRHGLLQLDLTCNANCSCDQVRYTPVCSQYGDRSYISPCHAGCSGEKTTVNGTVVYTDCACVAANHSVTGGLRPSSPGGHVSDGACPADCMDQFYIFMGIVCLLKFSGATSRSANFLIGIRCVEERDKTVSMALGMGLLALFTFIPSPIFFGFIFDKTCLVWGKSCSGRGNCWTYDRAAMRTLLNFTAAGFVGVGALFDIAVWYYVKDVKIFDEEIELKHVEKNGETTHKKLLEEKEVEK
ncbi:solute carrier organic anion transporter family member 74D-like [Bacillus rossius redtenbacheri]|uniref:solute carrier organic anion transporter family member 74D-like n=1 Tax=Bacillus rossius redtenbacheri TaxID=93214 RepID=UPI002FDCA5E1